MALARADLESLLRSRRLDRTLTTAQPVRHPDDEYATGPTGVDALDRSLDGGLPRGQLSEIVGPRTSGRTSLLVQLLAAGRRYRDRDTEVIASATGTCLDGRCVEGGVEGPGDRPDRRAPGPRQLAGASRGRAPEARFHAALRRGPSMCPPCDGEARERRAKVLRGQAGTELIISHKDVREPALCGREVEVLEQASDLVARSAVADVPDAQSGLHDVRAGDGRVAGAMRLGTQADDRNAVDAQTSP